MNCCLLLQLLLNELHVLFILLIREVLKVEGLKTLLEILLAALKGQFYLVHLPTELVELAIDIPIDLDIVLDELEYPLASLVTVLLQ